MQRPAVEVPDRRPICRPAQAEPEEQAQAQAHAAAYGHPAGGWKPHGQAGQGPAQNPQIDLTQAGARTVTGTDLARDAQRWDMSAQQAVRSTALETFLNCMFDSKREPTHPALTAGQGGRRRNAKVSVWYRSRGITEY